MTIDGIRTHARNDQRHTLVSSHGGSSTQDRRSMLPICFSIFENQTYSRTIKKHEKKSIKAHVVLLQILADS